MTKIIFTFYLLIFGVFFQEADYLFTFYFIIKLRCQVMIKEEKLYFYNERAKLDEGEHFSFYSFTGNVFHFHWRIRGFKIRHEKKFIHVSCITAAVTKKSKVQWHEWFCSLEIYCKRISWLNLTLDLIKFCLPTEKCGLILLASPFPSVNHLCQWV